MLIKLYLYIYIVLLISCGTLTGNPEGAGGDDSSEETNNTETIDNSPDSDQTAEHEEDGNDKDSENIASGEDSDGVKSQQEIEVLSNAEMLAQNDNNSSIKIFLTDAPIDAFSHIMIHLDKVVIIGEQGEIEKDVEDTLLNILDLQGGAAALIADFDSAPYGTYSEIRLVLVSGRPSYGILESGEELDFAIPSSTSSGIKIKYNFEMAEDQGENIVLDFDLRKSIRQQGNGSYFMTPVLRPVLQSDSGAIEFTLKNKASVVCAYKELSVAENDSDCDLAVSSANEKDGKYKLSFLPQGSYVLKIVYKDLQETLIENVEVFAGKTSELTD